MKLDLVIRQGATFQQVFRWETSPIVYRPITSIARQAPVRLTVPAHGLTDGWRAAVVGAGGMTEINASSPIKRSDYHPVTVVDTDTLDFNDVNAERFKAYTSGGYLQYNTPVDLTGYTARMTARKKLGGDVLFERDESDGIAISPSAKTITLTISATESAAFTFTSGVYDLEMVSPTGDVYVLAEGAVRLTKEVTT